MKIIRVSLSALLVWVASPVLAQFVEVTDNTCTEGIACAGAGSQDCDSTTFSLTTARNVRLCASIKCTTTNCVNCRSVAYIYDSNNIQRGCAYNDCETDCDERCQTIENLPAGNYTLYSCKLNCTGVACTSCTNDCVAKARVDLFP